MDTWLAGYGVGDLEKCNVVINGSIRVTNLNRCLSYYLPKTFISPIDVIDLFPMLNKGITTIRILNGLQFITTGKCSKASNMQNSVLTSVNTEEYLLIRQEEQLIQELLILYENSNLLELSIDNYTIYDLVRVQSLMISNGTSYNKITGIFIRKVLKHLKMDPLLISVILDDIGYVEKYLNNIRSYKSRAYKLCWKENTLINRTIRSNLALTLFLCKEVLSSFPKDIYMHVISLEIF